MGRTLRNLVSVLYSFAYLGWIKILHPRKFHYGFVQRISPGVPFFVEGDCRLGDRVRIHGGSRIVVQKRASLKIDSNVSINNDCYVVSLDRIEIGANTTFGPRVLVYDHDHDYKVGIENKKFKTSPVVIGKNCWIGANSVILRGTMLGDNCVVGAGSVVKGSYPDNSLIIQKRETVVGTIERVLIKE